MSRTSANSVGAEAAVDGQQVAGVEVAVEPDRRATPPGGARRRVPQLGHRCGLEHAADLGDGEPSRAVPVGQRPAGQVLPGVPGGDVLGCEPLQGSQEPGQFEGGCGGVGQCLDGRHLALQPAGHRPGPRITEVRVTDPHRNRDGQGKVRGESGQPLEFLPGLPDGSGMAGQPDRQLLAQPVDRVVGAGRLERLQGQSRPLRELGVDQAPGQFPVDPGGRPWSSRIPRACPGAGPLRATSSRTHHSGSRLGPSTGFLDARRPRPHMVGLPASQPPGPLR